MANTKKAIFYPIIEGDVPTYYDNITGLLGGAMGTKYKTSADTLTQLGGHNGNIPKVIKSAYDAEQAAQSATNAKTQELDKSKTDMLRELQRITGLEIWDETDGEALGIRKSKTLPDLNSVKPKFTGTTVLPDQVILDWLKLFLKGVVIYSSYDGVNFAEIGRDYRSPYEDKRKNKTVNVPETRYYKMRYLFGNDEIVGLESDVIKVTVEIY